MLTGSVTVDVLAGQLAVAKIRLLQDKVKVTVILSTMVFKHMEETLHVAM